MSDHAKYIPVSVRLEKQPIEEMHVSVRLERPTEETTTSAAPGIGAVMNDAEFRSYFRSLFPGWDAARIAARLNRRPGDVWEILEGIRPPDTGLLKLMGLQMERSYRITSEARVSARSDVK